MDPELWTVEDVGEYLEKQNFKQYRRLFCDENKIDGRVLLSLTENDLKLPPLNITPFGDVKRLLFLIDNLKDRKKRMHAQRKGYILEKQPYSTLDAYINIDESSTQSGTSSPSCGVSLTDSDDDFSISGKKLKVEPKKFALSVLYIFSIHFFSGYAVTYAQEHLPDKKKYPPLPDIFLDSLPYIPWAYKVTEGAIIVLSIFGLTLLFFHKYRYFYYMVMVMVEGRPSL
jgi:hypothetical protein